VEKRNITRTRRVTIAVQEVNPRLCHRLCHFLGGAPNSDREPAVDQYWFECVLFGESLHPGWTIPIEKCLRCQECLDTFGK
jgi:hypothetical protein